jgi:hypothetical protein
MRVRFAKGKAQPLGHHVRVTEGRRGYAGELVSMVCLCLLGLLGVLRLDDWHDPFRWLALVLLVGCAIRIAVLARR